MSSDKLPSRSDGLTSPKVRYCPYVKYVSWDDLDDPENFICSTCKHFECVDPTEEGGNPHVSCLISVAEPFDEAVIDCSKYEESCRSVASTGVWSRLRMILSRIYTIVAVPARSRRGVARVGVGVVPRTYCEVRTIRVSCYRCGKRKDIPATHYVFPYVCSDCRVKK